MRTRRLLGPVAFLSAWLASTASPSFAVPPQLSSAWATASVWDDGLAEVAHYRASRVAEGELRDYEAVFITVKEDFDARDLVKADPPYGVRPIVTVLKQNVVREIPTPNYDVRMMTSTFVERAAPARLLKLTSGSHEWCGNTWKALRSRDGRATYEWASYFDGEGDGRQALELREGDLAEDQLALALRGLTFREGLALETRLLPSLATTRGGSPEWEDATIRVIGAESVTVPAGTFRAWRVEVGLGTGFITLWFDAAGTHPLVKQLSARGDTLELARLERRAYWRNGP
jgi:hypothetical protein